MQGDIEHVVAERVQLSQFLVDGKAQEKQVPVFGGEGIEKLLIALGNDRAVIKGKGRF